jgi:hypothetical protein
MKFSITRLEQIVKLLAEEIGEILEGQAHIHINEAERMMRELVKEAANLGMRQAIEKGEERYGNKEVNVSVGKKFS